MKQSLKFNDGTVCENSHAMENGYGLYIYLGGGISMIDALGILSDSKKTSQIQYNYNKVKLVFDGYTKPVTINDIGTAITAIMVKDGEQNGKN